MPQVGDEDDPVLIGVIPRLVLEVVVKHQALTLDPGAHLVADPDCAVAGRNRDPEVAPEPEVCRTAVRRDVRPRPHPGDVDEAGEGAHRLRRLQSAGGDRAGRADGIVTPAALVEERHVPVA